MTKSNPPKFIILLIGIGLILGFLAQAAKISGAMLTQPVVTLTPRAYLPIVVQFVVQSTPFVKTEYSPFYLQNFVNGNGCNWMGIAYEIQLEASSGTAVSLIYAFQTSAICHENLVRFDFIQIR